MRNLPHEPRRPQPPRQSAAISLRPPLVTVNAPGLRTATAFARFNSRPARAKHPNDRALQTPLPLPICHAAPPPRQSAAYIFAPSSHEGERAGSANCHRICSFQRPPLSSTPRPRPANTHAVRNPSTQTQPPRATGYLHLSLHEPRRPYPPRRIAPYILPFPSQTKHPRDRPTNTFAARDPFTRATRCPARRDTFASPHAPALARRSPHPTASLPPRP